MPSDVRVSSVQLALGRASGALRPDPRTAGSSSAAIRSTELEALYLRVADTLERSAQLADQHAQRSGAGQRKLAAIELERAKRARMAAARGRALASRLRYSGTHRWSETAPNG